MNVDQAGAHNHVDRCERQRLKFAIELEVQMFHLKLILAAILLISCSAAESALVARYSFSGNTLDLSDNEYHGVASNITPTVDRGGAANSAYLFNGTDSSIAVQDAAPLRLSGTDFTIAVWVMETQRNASFADTIVSKRGQGVEDGWIFSVRGALGNVGTLSFGLSGGNDPRAESTGIVELDQWQHVAVVYDEKLKRLEMYINGILDSVVTNMPSPNESTSVDITIGGDSAGQPYNFHGSIDELHFFDHALTPEGILSVMTNGLGANGDLICEPD